MEGKLIKLGEELFELYTQGFLKGSTNHELIDSLNAEEVGARYKLSLSNCQAIERGYDLDELATEFAEKRLGRKISKWGNVDAHSAEYACFYHGFQKALEILGDKKFTEEDMRAAFSYGMDVYAEPNDWEKLNTYQKLNKHIQQTEWDVMIEMESIGKVKTGVGSNTNQMMPKLDENGCLILKRKK